MAYLDTSVLGAYYCIESTSAAVNRALADARITCISFLTRVEFASLISMKARTGAVDPHIAMEASRAFLRHAGANLYRLIPLEERDYVVAHRWLLRMNTPLRTLDAMHLAIAWNRRQRLWTTDKGLAHAARVLNIPHRLIVA